MPRHCYRRLLLFLSSVGVRVGIKQIKMPQQEKLVLAVTTSLSE